MRKGVGLLLLLVLVWSGVPGFLSVKAELKTINVPDDCLTIGSALGNASGGDTIFVRMGTYREHSLVIDKPLTLVGENPSSTIITNIDNPWASWNGEFPPPSTVTIQISADNVKISNFTIMNASANIVGSGSQFKLTNNIITRGYVRIEGNNNSITNNTIETYIECKGFYNDIAENTIIGNSEGLVLEGSFNVVHGNILLNGINIGRIDVKGDGNVIFKNTITNSSAGVYIYEGSENAVYENRIVNNRGAISLGKGYRNTFYRNYVANNIVGASISWGQTEINYKMLGPCTNDNSLYHNNFINNTYQVGTGYEMYGTDFFDSGKEGNYWSDYIGNDTNGDGIGDTSYIIDERRRDNFPLMLPFDIDNNKVVLPTPPQSESSSNLPSELIAASVGAVVVVGVGLLLFRKRKRGGEHA